MAGVHGVDVVAVFDVDSWLVWFHEEIHHIHHLGEETSGVVAEIDDNSATGAGIDFVELLEDFDVRSLTKLGELEDGDVVVELSGEGRDGDGVTGDGEVDGRASSIDTDVDIRSLGPTDEVDGVLKGHTFSADSLDVGDDVTGFDARFFCWSTFDRRDDDDLAVALFDVSSDSFEASIQVAGEVGVLVDAVVLHVFVGLKVVDEGFDSGFDGIVFVELIAVVALTFDDIHDAFEDVEEFDVFASGSEETVGKGRKFDDGLRAVLRIPGLVAVAQCVTDGEDVASEAALESIAFVTRVGRGDHPGFDGDGEGAEVFAAQSDALGFEGFVMFVFIDSGDADPSGVEEQSEELERVELRTLREVLLEEVGFCGNSPGFEDTVALLIKGVQSHADTDDSRELLGFLVRLVPQTTLDEFLVFEESRDAVFETGNVLKLAPRDGKAALSPAWCDRSNAECKGEQEGTGRFEKVHKSRLMSALLFHFGAGK